jgi:cell division protein FtsW
MKNVKRVMIRKDNRHTKDYEQTRNTYGHSLKYEKPKRLDTGLLIVVVLLICFGMLMLFSASMAEGFSLEQNSLHFISKQLLFTVFGSIIALMIAICIPIRHFDHFWMVVILYVGMALLLIMVFIKPVNPIVYGVVINGSRRWIRVLGFQFQPSELAKVLIIFCYAGYTSWKKRKRDMGGLTTESRFLQPWYDGFLDIVFPVIAYVVWAALILIQPHISWIVITGILMLFLLFATKIPLKSWICGIVIVLAIALLIALVLTAIYPLLPDSIQNYVSYEYALRRIAIFMNPEAQDSDSLLQTTQSINAIGSGGLTGVGPGNSIQKWGYLPMQYNDYVFSIIAEELGFLGAVAVIALFLTFLFMGVRVALRSTNNFAMLVAFGFSGIITLQAFLNIGVATGLLPPTGISLPFFSYGGSSTTFFLIGIGLLLSVSKSGVRQKKRGDVRA